MSIRAPSASVINGFQQTKKEGEKKKRLSSNKPLTDVTANITNLSNIQLNDDESEKARLREEKARAAEEAHQKKNESLSSSFKSGRKSLGGRVSNAAATASSSLAHLSILPPVAPPKPMDLKALNTMFTDCLKLATANKITVKNTWSLDFISHMGELLLTKDGSNNNKKSSAIFDENGDIDELSDNNQFQKASCSLDASMMIYSTRVDDVHKTTFRVLGGLSNGGVGSAHLDDDEDENAEGAAPGDQPKKKRAKKAGAATLEPNPSKLDTRLLETEVEIDPLFHLTTAKFEGGAGGMLMNNLSVYSGVRLCLDSSEEYVLAPRPPIGTPEQQAELQAKQEAQLHMDFDFSGFEEQFNKRLTDLNMTVNELRLTPTVDYFIQMKAELLAGGDGSIVQQAEQAANEVGKKKGKKAAAKEVPVVAPPQIDIDLPALDTVLPPMEPIPDHDFIGGGGGFDQDDDVNEPFTCMVAQEVAQLDHAIAQEEALNRSLALAASNADGDEQSENVDEDGVGSVASAQSKRHLVEEEEPIGYGLLDGLEDMKVNWAGLKHWKFKAKPVPKVSGAKGKKKRVAKPKEVLDFSSVAFAPVAPAKPPTEAGKRALQTPYPTIPTERRARQAELALPEDRFYKLRSLQTLCQKPNVMVKLRRPGANTNQAKQRLSGDMRVVDSEMKVQEDGSSVIDAIPSSSDSIAQPSTPVRDAVLQIVPVSARLTPQPGDLASTASAEDPSVNVLQFADGDDDDENGGGAFGFHDDDHLHMGGSANDAEESNPFGGPSAILDLIAAPTRAEKIEVSYDRVSKTVDVKALKAAMWTGVTETLKPVTIEGKPLKQTTFQTAIDTVPDNFPARVAHQLPAVSVSYCFISMLHLCNEHGLTLLAPGSNADAESANRIPDVKAAEQQYPQQFIRDTDHVKLIGEKEPQAYYVGDFLVRQQ